MPRPGVPGPGLRHEASRRTARVCFEDLGLRRVVALSFADNTASWRLMERLGMRREAYNVRDSLHRNGEWLDGVGYALLAEEWRDRNPADGSLACCRDLVRRLRDEPRPGPHG